MHFTRVFLCATFSALFYYAEASPSITSPLGSNWQAGTTQTITWIDNGDKEGMPEYFDLYLMAGKMTALQQVGVIATNITTKPGQYKWDIPKETPSGKDYAIRIGAPPSVSYSPYFEISGGAGSRPDSNVSGNGSSGTDTKPQSNGTKAEEQKPNSSIISSAHAKPSEGIITRHNLSHLLVSSMFAFYFKNM
ncbi:hypothetical protein K493DRAFT_346526 [Basidiobolus meristosporus CBS 931.73]|uniref:Yeast cell wall synthesis Kre9/Knh1-like N-terminal domain-containing protein n=1 Tax=Basidiobolus meristosporus CBS 931.73 TaxID=1314790 RepID=A0A1Y1YXZ1_9FUNG|nr:hypothetical protein K493DRAFT_346526 [Basidiobolus meristosporus CBS 931.73]|eukprot:ORY02806.1 hypothetical protein K493DRAFT_346526 [Basidiobolus meristosporus CBS 931.73]